MKIIKEGRLPRAKVYRAECNNCGTIFEFKKEEAQYTSDQRDGDFLTIGCPLPLCSRRTTIYTSRLALYEVKTR